LCTLVYRLLPESSYIPAGTTNAPISDLHLYVGPNLRIGLQSAACIVAAIRGSEARRADEFARDGLGHQFLAGWFVAINEPAT
jgi:hypothetical protein